jgi:hypothetical protein
MSWSQKLAEPWNVECAFYFRPGLTEDERVLLTTYDDVKISRNSSKSFCDQILAKEQKSLI